MQRMRSCRKKVPWFLKNASLVNKTQLESCLGPAIVALQCTDNNVQSYAHPTKSIMPLMVLLLSLILV